MQDGERTKLRHPHSFAGLYEDTENPWFEVFEYLEEHDDLDRWECIFLCGDGTSWMQKGREILPKSIFVLDRFHLLQYVQGTFAHCPHLFPELHRTLQEGNWEGVQGILRNAHTRNPDPKKRNHLRDLKTYLARSLGIATVYQEQQLIPGLTVAENLFLGREWRARGGWVDFGKLFAEAQRVIDLFGLSLDPRAKVESLSVAERQEVAILKVLQEKTRVILLDEPTAALSREQVQFFFDFVNRLREQGMAILYISHHLEEVLTIAQKVTVLRDGQKVGTFQSGEVDKEALVEKMAGHRLARKPTGEKSPPREVVLEVENLGDGKNFQGVSFLLRRGEIVGFLGVTGSGCRSVLRALAGLHKWSEGKVTIQGKVFKLYQVTDAVELGIFFMPEDMRREGLVLPLGFTQNITLSRLRKVLWRGFIHPGRERAVGQEYVHVLNIAVPGERAEVAILSGGNQRKVLLARALFSDAWCWLLEDPTQGIDVEARAEVHHLLLQARSLGKSILLFSSDFDELITVTDRILVFHRGKVVQEIDRPEQTTPQELLRLMLGG
ncbi:sugar ABC transporter ATP-binding protein [Atrimonas thermophila]